MDDNESSSDSGGREIHLITLDGPNPHGPPANEVKDYNADVKKEEEKKSATPE